MCFAVRALIRSFIVATNARRANRQVMWSLDLNVLDSIGPTHRVQLDSTRLDSTQLCFKLHIINLPFLRLLFIVCLSRGATASDSTVLLLVSHLDKSQSRVLSRKRSKSGVWWRFRKAELRVLSHGATRLEYGSTDYYLCFVCLFVCLRYSYIFCLHLFTITLPFLVNKSFT